MSEARKPFARRRALSAAVDVCRTKGSSDFVFMSRLVFPHGAMMGVLMFYGFGTA